MDALVKPGSLDVLSAAEHAYTSHELIAGRDAAGLVWSCAGNVGPNARAASRGRAGFLLAHFLYRLGQFHELLEQGPQVVDLLAAGVADGPAGACQVLRWMALGGAEIGEFETAIAAARRGLELAQREGNHAAHVLLSNALAACFERMGDPWQAERLLREALVEAEQDGGDLPRFVTHNNLTAVALTAYGLLRDGESEAEAAEAAAVLVRARQDATQGLRLAQRIDDPFYRVYIESNLGDVLGFLGEHDAAESHLRRSLALAGEQGFATLVLRVQCSLGELALQRGLVAEACALLEPLLQSMPEQTPAATVMRCHLVLYRAHRQLGDAEAALACLERYQQLNRRRVLSQLRAQARNLVTRAEVEQAYRDARFHRERAAALTEVAAQDSLTGLTSRWGLEQRLQGRPGSELPLAVALLDMDNFKSVNDRFGHAAGDAVLIEVAGLLRQELRQHDLIARLGGDEFAIVLPGADREQAAAALERIRRAAVGLRGPGLPGDWPLRLSIGLAMMRSHWDPKQPLGEWLAVVDDALYDSKRLGGDRLTVATH